MHEIKGKRGKLLNLNQFYNSVDKCQAHSVTSRNDSNTENIQAVKMLLVASKLSQRHILKEPGCFFFLFFFLSF